MATIYYKRGLSGTEVSDEIRKWKEAHPWYTGNVIAKPEPETDHEEDK